MSRVANNPVPVPGGVEVNIDGQSVKVKSGSLQLEHTVHPLVRVTREDEQVVVKTPNASREAVALAGTTRALINNMVVGVKDGFEKKLELVGVGYRAKAQGKKLALTLGFSHPVDYPVPDGITIETPSQTEVVIKGIDKQKVGQVAAEIRAYRPPEPYKGKGVRYADEQITLKEAKKK
ncbi:MAG: 50S ribosomal protein L6 [Gammaproteobacteria bacterium]|nr:50S ribosomal protein L6 [Gammaproteobacteria bacterium]